MAKTLIVTGGLGNQMFEYAFLLALRSKGHEVKMDTSYYEFVKMHNGYELERVFGIREKLLNRQGMHVLWLRYLNRFRPKCLYMADDMAYKPECLERPGKYLWGYWQDERYFVDMADTVRQVFQFQGIDDYNRSIAQEMAKKCSVSLHVRRGDYATFGMNLIGDDYYSKAIDHISTTANEKPFFFIFSDDAEVAKSIADKMGISYVLMSHNKDNDSYKDMYLMSQCKNNILDNSRISR